MAFATLKCCLGRQLTTVGFATELLWSFLYGTSPFLTQYTRPHFQNPLLCSVSSTIYLSCHALKVLAVSVPKSLSRDRFARPPLINGLRRKWQIKEVFSFHLRRGGLCLPLHNGRVISVLHKNEPLF